MSDTLATKMSPEPRIRVLGVRCGVGGSEDEISGFSDTNIFLPVCSTSTPSGQLFRVNDSTSLDLKLADQLVTLDRGPLPSGFRSALPHRRDQSTTSSSSQRHRGRVSSTAAPIISLRSLRVKE